LLLPLAAASQAAEPPSPIAAAELYIRTLVNHDEQAISQLNDYLRPDRLRSGRSADYANAAELKQADKDFPREVTDVALPLFPEAQRNALRAPVESLMSTVQKARQQSQCKTVSATKPKLDKHGVLNTEVKFSCQLVKTPRPGPRAFNAWCATSSAWIRCRANSRSCKLHTQPRQLHLRGRTFPGHGAQGQGQGLAQRLRERSL
jgi:hypothetical protein